jgi:hypothetical protein
VSADRTETIVSDQEFSSKPQVGIELALEGVGPPVPELPV